ncbi:MAG: carbohydrate-binding family 6 protein [Halanaerobiales bacterium]
MAYKDVYIFSKKENPKLNFATSEIKKALKEKGYSVKIKPLETIEKHKKRSYIRVIIGTLEKDKELINNNIDIPDSLGKESYIIYKKIEKNNFEYWIIGGESLGSMYGGLDFSDKILIDDIYDIEQTENSPYVKNRGIKLNIPLDARTPSYADAGDAAQNNIKVMWNLNFWKEYIDSLARNKYNIVSLWNLHPFPSMIKVEDYPGVALDNVMRADINWEKFNVNYKLSGENMVNEKILSNLKIEKKLSIDEKILFWKKVFKYGKDRGIQFYIITWNIFTWGAHGKYGIDNLPQNDSTIDYIRKSVKTLLETYPLLSGIGVTAGENMGHLSPQEKEEWLFETYGKGILDVLKNDPNRQIRFIHRYWWSDLDDILGTFKPLINKKNIKFDFSFKYSKAHMYSDPDPKFSDKIYESLSGTHKMWCNIRNDDIFHLRWGDADYVRKYIMNLPSKKKSPGFYMGSDGYVFGQCINNTPTKSGQMEIDKHWYNYMLWGELSYNPQKKNTFFKNIIMFRFNLEERAAEIIHSAWKSASKIIPLVTKFHWNDWDFQWNVESCSGRDGFHTVDDFITNPTMEGTNLINISDYCSLKIQNEQISDFTTPVTIASNLKERADYSLKLINKLSVEIEEELKQTMDDIYAMSYLGYYYSYKIKSAINLCFYRKTENRENCYHKQSVKNLKNALTNWKYYSNIMSSNYGDTLLGRVGKIQWNKITENVKEDIEKVYQLQE